MDYNKKNYELLMCNNYNFLTDLQQLIIFIHINQTSHFYSSLLWILCYLETIQIFNRFSVACCVS